MNINFQDQRANKTTELSVDMDALRTLAEKAGIPEGTEVRFRIRDEKDGTYGRTKKIHENVYRVVVNVIYKKPELSEAAQYVVNNTALHELRHVAQGQQSGWHNLSPAYNGWSETEAREFGKSIKGLPEFFAIK